MRATSCSCKLAVDTKLERTRPWAYLIGILENDMKGVIELLNENSDSNAPLMVQLTSQKVGPSLAL